MKDSLLPKQIKLDTTEINYEDIWRTNVLFQTPLNGIMKSIKDEQNAVIYEAFQQVGVNPNVVEEQQKEINQLRAFIEQEYCRNLAKPAEYVVSDSSAIGSFRCRTCGWNLLWNEHNYCPHCGQKLSRADSKIE